MYHVNIRKKLINYHNIKTYVYRFNHFEVLGVSINSNDNEIRKSYYQKAKSLHPDVTTTYSVEEATKKFIELKNAYDTLSNPESRLQYMQQLHRQKQSTNDVNHHNVNSTYNKEYGYNAYTFDEDEIRARNFQRRRRRRKVVDTIATYQNSWDDFKKELENALDKAYYGPAFYKNDIQEFPEQFEVEIRKTLLENQDNIDIMHICSGRQLLGSVHFYNKYEEILHLHYDNKLYARAKRKTSNDRKSTIINFEKIDVTNTEELFIGKGKIITSDNFDILFNHNDEETHRIVKRRMPGVEHIYFHSIKGFVELKMSHASMPPEFMWIWEPRDADFIRSWYYETNKGGKYSRNRYNNTTNNNLIENNNNIELYDEKNHLDISLSILYLGFKELDKLKNM